MVSVGASKHLKEDSGVSGQAGLTEKLMKLYSDLEMMMLRIVRYKMMAMRNISTTATCTQEGRRQAGFPWTGF